jgi:hypothetical protein
LRGAPGVQDGRFGYGGLEEVIKEFQTGQAWQRRRNKVKGLQEPLRAGPVPAEHYRRTYALPPLPALLPGQLQTQITGWSGERDCIYFDALELMDHHVALRLPPRPAKENSA